MDDMMNKLQNILNDEESMKQIQELASMLTADAGASPQPQNNSSKPDESRNSSENNQKNNADFSQILKSLNLSSGNNPQNQNSSDFDISKLMKIQQIVQTANKPDKNITLLLALKPLLRQENQLKIDRLVKVFRLFSIYPILKESGLGGDLLGIF